jgi:hypothetical protein
MNASTDRLLRRTLWGNAVFSVVSGAVLAAFAGPFARIAAHGPVALMGLDLRIVFELLGVGVIAFGALCAWVASRETLPQGWARVIFAADIAWVVGSVLVLALPATWTMGRLHRHRGGRADRGRLRHPGVSRPAPARHRPTRKDTHMDKLQLLNDHPAALSPRSWG